MKENKDNWLKEELEREKKISVWDMDEASLLREEHSENCDRRKNSDEHHLLHVKAVSNQSNSEEEIEVASILRGVFILFVAFITLSVAAAIFFILFNFIV